MWAEPPAGTCGGGPARPPYETLTVSERVTGASPRGHPPPARIHSHEMVRLAKLVSVPATHRRPTRHAPSHLTILRLKTNVGIPMMHDATQRFVAVDIHATY